MTTRWALHLPSKFFATDLGVSEGNSPELTKSPFGLCQGLLHLQGWQRDWPLLRAGCLLPGAITLLQCPGLVSLELGPHGARWREGEKLLSPYSLTSF